MKAKWLFLAIVLSLLICDGLSEKPRKFKKYKKHKTSSTTEETHDEPEPDAFQLMEKDEEDEKKKEDMKKLSEEENKSPADETSQNDETVKNNNVPLNDPCSIKHCGAGRICDVTAEGKAECVCVPVCPHETDPRRKVCTNHNETWGSDCEVYQMRCWCDHNHQNCLGEEFKHIHIDYYGTCKEMPTCSEEEMADFPRRMRDWLFNIMRDMADREELSPHYMKMEKEAESNLTRKWTNAAIWKWCDLDGHPHDRTVSRHELFPIRAPLLALEHCIGPFLDRCDENDDHRISLLEWGKCLELPEDDLEEKCDELRDD